MQLLARPLIAASCLVSRPFAVIEHVVEESLAYSPLAEAEQEVNARVLADYPQSYEAIWVKFKMALYSSAGTLFESTRFPGSSGIYIIYL